jgi:acetyl-CoA C-acetyltransferase
MSAYVTGVGTSHFGKQADVPATTLAATAVREAIEDAGIVDPSVIQAVFVGTVFGAAGIASRVLQAAGITARPTLTFESACASGTTAFAEAVHAVRAGRYDLVLCLGVEHMSSVFDGAIHPEQTDPEGRAGLALPALYAMSASRYLADGAVTLEQLAMVSVKNHANALANSRAQYSGAYTVEEVLSSKMIADPLTLLQCCPISDGAAAAIVSARPVSDGRRDVEVVAVAEGTGRPWGSESPHVWGFDLISETARAAYTQAGLEPGDVQVLEIHDAFTIGEIVTTEALGLAPIGGGGELVVRGVTARDGKHAVNPSGGLLSRGHPLGATGIAQLAEVTWQLRGEGGDRQVPGATVGLVETMGGGAAGVDGNACVVALLKGKGFR